MRNVGVGLTGMKKFCGLMDLPPPVSQSSNDAINLVYASKAEKVARESMDAAVEEEKAQTLDEDGVPSNNQPNNFGGWLLAHERIFVSPRHS